MSREDNSANMTAYMRAQCDVFLQTLQIKMITEVTSVINSVKTEMYQLIEKKAGVFSTEFVNTPLESELKSMDEASESSTFVRQRKRRVRKRKLTVGNPVRSAFTEGSSSDSAPDFSGAVPDIFLYRCKKDTDAEVVKNSLINKGVNVKSVDLKSHANAATRSFIVCVESSEDYDRLISGDCIPRYVRVRDFIHFRHSNSDESSWGHASSVIAPSRNDALPVDLSRPRDNSGRRRDSNNVAINNSLVSKHSMVNILSSAQSD